MTWGDEIMLQSIRRGWESIQEYLHLDWFERSLQGTKSQSSKRSTKVATTLVLVRCSEHLCEGR